MIVCCKLGIAVDVHFYDGAFVTDFLFYLLEDGCLHFAGTTPGGEEVNEGWSS